MQEAIGEVLIFSGTTEGRLLSRRLTEHGIPVTVCVATAYGQEIMEQEEKTPVRQVRTGRLDAAQMEAMLREKPWKAVVDATHPFAVEVSENIARACASQGKELFRLLRREDECSIAAQSCRGNVTYVDTIAQAVAYLNERRGNIFLTTGSKELPEYLAGLKDRSRVYVRILPNGAEVEKCRGLGLQGKQIICMQGPFSAELNLAMIKAIQASVLVTKETSHVGGFSEKLYAAAQAGIHVVVIRRPKEHGFSMEEILQRLGVEDKPPSDPKRITLAGIGMGDLSNMTREAYEACEEAECILGGARILETVKHLGKPMENLYRVEEIADYLKQHPKYREIVVLFSGDVGFYSGAKQFCGLCLPDYQIRQICGVPSVVYFASRLGVPWEDLPLVSLHGRRQNLIGILETRGKAFVLTDGASGIRRLCRELLDYGFFETNMYVGYQLSYPQEEILQGVPEDFLDYGKEGASVVILKEPRHRDKAVTPGIPEEAFFRGKVPITKEEVRSVTLSKLALTESAVVWDIGAGTGSVAIECARLAAAGRVYAIERKQEALELLEKNKRKHRVWNLEIVAGKAPEVLEALPVPTHAFIGGSGGRLKDILGLLWRKNPQIRLVLNVISLKTLQEVMEWMDGRVFSHKEMVQVSVAKAKELGDHPMMMGQNPVYVITLQK